MEDEKNILEEEDTLKDKYLTFTLGDEVYGIDISVVIEIIVCKGNYQSARQDYPRGGYAAEIPPPVPGIYR